LEPSWCSELRSSPVISKRSGSYYFGKRLI